MNLEAKNLSRTLKKSLPLAISFGVLANLGAVQAHAAIVTSIHFQSSSTASEIDIDSDSPVTFTQQQNSADKQIIVDLKNTALSKSAARSMDTSSFDSKVLLISPYEVGGSSKDSRVVIQLRDWVSADVTQSGNVLKIRVPNAPGAAASTSQGSDQSQASAAAERATPASGDLSSTSNETTGAPGGSNAPMPAASALPQVGTETAGPDGTASRTASVGIKDKLQQFIDARQTRRFVGKPITLKVRDADLSDVFRLIGDASGFNIVVGDDVKGKITLSLQDVPWDQALDVILTTQKLGAERNNNVLRIVTLDNLTKEKEAELAAKQAAEASAPRVTRVFPISYAKLDGLAAILSKFSSPPPVGAQGASASEYSAVIPDTRTNSIIVRDTEANIERMEKLIHILDTQTPQVLIEAKVIEATENYSNQLTGSLGFGSNPFSSSQWMGSFAGADPIDPLFSINGSSPTTASIFTNGNAAATAATGGNFGLSPTLGFLPGNIRLNALLQLDEAEQDIRIISSPKAVVLDKEKATILESTPVLTVVTTLTATGPITTPTVAQANLSLDVTPTITNEGSVLMQLTVSRDVPQTVGVAGQATQAVANRNISTRVLVESGSTLVMGGIYTMDNEDDSSGFPFLRKIPILGMLFGSDAKTNDRTELFFFITPRILNLKESGITST